MPLIILGIIVVGGGLFLLISNLKPAIGRRLRGGYNGFGFGGFDRFGALQNPGQEPGPTVEVGQAPDAQPKDEKAGDNKDKDDDGKVLFVFGSGEREERSLDEDDKHDK